MSNKELRLELYEGFIEIAREGADVYKRFPSELGFSSPVTEVFWESYQKDAFYKTLSKMFNEMFQQSDETRLAGFLILEEALVQCNYFDEDVPVLAIIENDAFLKARVETAMMHIISEAWGGK